MHLVKVLQRSLFMSLDWGTQQHLILPAMISVFYFDEFESCKVVTNPTRLDFTNYSYRLKLNTHTEYYFDSRFDLSKALEYVL